MASDELMEWCREHGVIRHGIECALVEHGWRGVIATQDLEADTCVLRVPLRLLLTAQSAHQDRHLHVVLSSPLSRTLGSEQVLAIHLLAEVAKGEASFWRPYLLSLPREYSTAMYFSAEETMALQVPHAQQAVQSAAEVALSQWRQALPALRALALPSKYLTKQAWLWAASTLSSRTMYLPFDPAGGLTPFGDLHNYAPPPPPFTPTLITPPPPPTQQARQQQQEPEAQACEGQRRLLSQHPEPLVHCEQHDASRAQRAALALDCLKLGEGQGEFSGIERGKGSFPRVSRPLHSLRCLSKPGPPASMDALGGRSGGGRGTAHAAHTAECDGSNRPVVCSAAAGVPPQETSPTGAEPCCAHWEQCAEVEPQRQQQQGQQAAQHAQCAMQQGCAARQDASGQQEVEEGGLHGVPGGGFCGDGALDEVSGEYRIYTRRRYRAGEQVFLCYGRHTNLELLQHYGFVLEDNPHDTAPLPRHSLPPEVALKLPPPSTPGDSSSNGCYVHHNGTPSWELLRALRLASASAAERRSKAYLALQDQAISGASEACALGLLREVCWGVLRSLPTDAAQDRRLLTQDAPALGGCARLAVEWRLGYKQILLRCAALCTQAIHQSTGTPAGASY